MSDWSDTFRDRYYDPGYVYIAGSLSHRVLKIGTTVNIGQQERRLRRTAYGSIEDWTLLYYVWVEEGGRIEHDARRLLKRYRQLRMYDKEGHRQKGREIVNCRFGIALEALTGLLDDAQRGRHQVLARKRVRIRLDASSAPAASLRPAGRDPADGPPLPQRRPARAFGSDLHVPAE
jgi:hypothetical protein